MTTSAFTWLDYDQDQARRTTELIRALSEVETVESMGIGGIRDGFARLFFPGTSTVQTRVRYFLLVPWALHHVAGRRPRDRAQFARWLKETEAATIEQLIAGSPAGAVGIVGRERRERTQRMPSSIYWAALGEWGIRVDNELTLSAFRDWVITTKPRDLIDGDLRDANGYLVFDEMPEAPAGFPHEPMSVFPTREEAGYLLGRMRETRLGGRREQSFSTGGDPSLLALVAQTPEWVELDNFWDLPARVLPNSLCELVHHARMFSLVMQGSRLRYVQLLFDERQRMALPVSRGRDDLDWLIDEWVISLREQLQEVRRWDRDLSAFFDVLGRHGVVVGDPTRAFVRAWSSMAATNPDSAMRNRESAALVRRREEALKAPNHRLGNPQALRTWDGSIFGSRPLDYRWGISRQLIEDCRDALKGPHAVS